jgi:DNA-dependent RNA polymerase auxiliary subunit epsilon
MFDYPEILVDPAYVKKIDDKGVSYDKNTGEIKLTKR